MRHFDLIIIGTGPAGQKAALQAAELGKTVAIVEKNEMVGGVAVNTGTIPSKALREAVMHLTGAGLGGLFGQNMRVKRTITMADLIAVSHQVIGQEWKGILEALDRAGVELIWGAGQFVEPHVLRVTRQGETQDISADKFLIAIGTRPARPPEIPFDDQTVFTSDGLLQLKKLPRSIIVVGGGVVGVEYGCILSVLGIRVMLIEAKPHVLGFLDEEVTEAFEYQMRQSGICLHMREKVKSIDRLPPDTPDTPAPPDTPDAAANHGMAVQATLESGKKVAADTLLYAVGRQGMCATLALDRVGVPFDDREKLHVNEHYQTAADYIYAAGDVIGFPSLASTSMEQGRLAACHMFGVPATSMPELFPYGIFAVPELAMVGKTEEQLTDAAVPYQTGVGRYRDTARGQLLGDDTGLLKLIIHQETGAILGVHIMGTSATELVHIGQMAIALGGKAEFLKDAVFNYPTLAEAYKLAAADGLRKVGR